MDREELINTRNISSPKWKERGVKKGSKGKTDPCIGTQSHSSPNFSYKNLGALSSVSCLFTTFCGKKHALSQARNLSQRGDIILTYPSMLQYLDYILSTGQIKHKVNKTGFYLVIN